jgi:hypothetical protein
MDDLTKIALIGTAKSAGDVAAGEHPTGDIFSAAGAADREELLLLRCGAQAVYDLAGREPAAGVEAISPALPESRPTGSRKLAGLLQNALATNANDLVVEFLRLMEAGRIVVPPDLLPQLLDCGDPQIRARALPVLGERGRWLSRLNPDWSWVERGVVHLSESGQQELRRLWDEGTIAERGQVLSRWRRSDPNEARDRLAEVFAKEKPKDRTSLLEKLEAGLSAADEPFLETCLADRSSSVVQAAARLLTRLPESALAGRMQARAAAMLGAESKGVLRKKMRLVCTPPEKIERDWERDGIAKQAPSGSGHRSCWAQSVLAAVPPSVWPKQFEREPAALIEAILDDPFADAILTGWTEAAARFAAQDAESAAWLVPLWEHWAGAAGRMQGRGRDDAIARLATLLPHIPRDQAEAGMLRLLESDLKSEGADGLNLLAELPRPWSADFTRKLLALVRQVLEKQSANAAYQWANALFSVARAIPAEAFPQALAPWQLAQSEASAAWHVNAIAREIDKFVEIIQTRQSFMAEVAGPGTSSSVEMRTK